MYAEGETRAYHALDDTPPAGFRGSAAHALDVFTNNATPVMDAKAARSVLAALESAITSASAGTVITVPKL